VSDGAGQPPGFYRSLKETKPAEEEMECDLRSNKLPWSIVAVTLSTNYGGAAPPGLASEHKRVRGSCEKITCWGCSLKQFVVTNQFESQAGDISHLARSYETDGLHQLWGPTSRTSG